MLTNPHIWIYNSIFHFYRSRKTQQIQLTIIPASVPNNKKMSMTFKISNQDVHTKQTNQKSSQTKRQHCCDPQCSGNYMLRMALLYRIRGWFYYVFIRGKDKRSECDLSRLSIIGDIPIRSSRKHSHLLTVTTFLPEKALKQ